MSLDAILWSGGPSMPVARIFTMAFTDDDVVLFDRLDEALWRALEPCRDLFAKIIACACTRIPLLGKPETTSRIDRLLQAGAWTDAALALIELELPMWWPRRLAYENGEWICSLSRDANVPAEFDDTVDASHESLALAIVKAFVEARRRSRAACDSAPVAPGLQPTAEFTVCCDNFA